MTNDNEEHFCKNVDSFPLDKFFQKGKGNGKRVLIVGESPAENGWRKSGKAFYTPENKLLATGRRLNELLKEFRLNVETCGFTELSKCFIGKNRKILGECCRKGWPIFVKQISGSESRLVIILGVIPTQIFGELTGKELTMGKMVKIEIGGKTKNILPIYHPSPVNPWGRERNRKIFEKYKKEIREFVGIQK